MREVVIVIPDLYPAAAEARSESAGTLPGLERMVRFGSSRAVTRGWRAWLAQWAGREDLADAAPASVAAAAVIDAEPSLETSVAERAGTAAMAWLATPVHFVASLTRVHLSGHGLLRLSRETLEQLAADFARVFGDTGYCLLPLASGEWLTLAPALENVSTADPARHLGASVEEALPHGPGAMVLRRLGAEVEMWLHDHPVNEARERSGEPRISALWLWGGGPATGPQERREENLRSIAFGSDSYVEGLWQLKGSSMRPLPRDFSTVLDVSAERAVLVVNQSMSEDPGLQAVDRRWIQPMLAALRDGAIDVVTLVANDRRLELRTRDRFKIWRRPRAALAGLQ